MQNDKNDQTDLLIVGLGNPGPRYQKTFHNVGFLVVEEFAERRGWSWKFENKFQAEVAKGEYQGVIFHLLRPETFMNLSGEAVREYSKYFNLSPERLIVVADDADIGFGELRFKLGGGAAGHNGLRSIQKELATSDFKRVRIGIGRPKELISLADYVLMQQGEPVWELMRPTIKKAASLLEKTAEVPFEEVMNTRINGV